MYIVIIFALLSALANSLNNIITKQIVDTTDFKDAVSYSMLFTAFMSLFIALSNWNFILNKDSITIILITSILQFITIAIGNYLLKEQGVSSANIYTRLNIALTFFIDISLGHLEINFKTISFFVLFSIAMILFFSEKKEKSFLKNYKIVLLLILNILSFTIRPYLLKSGLDNKLFSSESYLFLNYVLITIISFTVFKTKFKMDKSIFIQCGLKSIIKPIGALFYNKALAIGVISIVQVFSSMDIIITPLLSFIIFKEKLTKKYIIAVILILIAVNLLT